MRIFNRKPKSTGPGAVCMRRTDDALEKFHRDRAQRQMQDIAFSAFNRAYGLQDR